jgi:hypothetical protein
MIDILLAAGILLVSIGALVNLATARRLRARVEDLEAINAKRDKLAADRARKLRQLE